MKKLGCDRVYVEGFKENPNSFFGWIYFTITFCLLALISYFFIPALSLVFIALGLIICVLQFGLYKKLVDKFFKEKIGHNATGFKKPTGEVKRRIIFNGHPDAVWEWPFKYKFKYIGFDFHMMVCFIGAFYTLGIAIAKIAGISDGLAFKLGLGALVFVPFWFGLYFMWNERSIVDGANDNLSGCYIGMAILKMLHDEGIEFENTEVGVVLSGSEEAGIRGCFAHYNLGECTDEMLEHYKVINRGYWQAMERGEIEKPVLLVKRFEDFLNAYGLDSSVAAGMNSLYQVLLGETVVFAPHAWDTIQALKGKVLQCAVTNGTKVAQDGKLKNSKLDKEFDHIFIY
jgi:hypothetical protein